MTKALLRVREVVKFKEAHTVHATAEGADAQVKEGLQIYQQFFNILRIPYIVLRTPDWDTFAGAMYNYDVFTVMPDGKALELGSVINLGQKFAKAFGITFRDQKETERYPHQTCYGISERSLGAMLSLHGDDRGFIFLPEIAPIQLVIIPIFRTDKDVVMIKRYLNEVEQQLRDFRSAIDWSDHTPGWKFSHWEAKGIPVRLEIGPREVKKRNAVLLRRNSYERATVSLAELKKGISIALKDLGNDLAIQAQTWFQEQIWEASSLGEAIEGYSRRKGIIKLSWCGKAGCGQEMEEQLVGSALGYNEEENAYAGRKACASCGKPARHLLYFGRTH